VLEPLCAAIEAYDLPREDFDNLIYAREFDLEDRVPANLEGMVKYAEYTNAPLIALVLKVLGHTAAPEQVQVIAAAYGLTGLLRAVPTNLRQRRCYLPEDLIHRQEMSVYDLYDGSAVQKLPSVTRAVWQEAERQLQNLHTAPKPLRRMAKLTRLYLGQIQRVDFDVFSPKLSVPPLLREIRVLFS
jgi:phytoene synthase